MPVAKIAKKSPAPLYLGAAVWLLWGWFLPLYRLSDILLAAGVSFGAIAVGKLIFPNQTYETPEAKQQEAPKAEEKKAETTGNSEIDALIAERDKAVSEMKRLNANIPDEKISRQIDHLEETTRKIIAQVVAEPGKLPQIRKFMNYYLPTTLKLLNAYDRMDSAGVSGENIDGTKGKIEEMLDTIVVAFDKQLDSLFSDEALDIATDIKVMENLRAQEGLGESI
ncbi:MAG: 5-bromo-4-chloroindolyl phosphate hydrolysis family protein, partial [Oscillospiraceae bacterium]|nr:5-bromo-4-chloroindolyl phosphate hydrolysis family protein [Oscillospiraceae bacterium]